MHKNKVWMGIFGGILLAVILTIGVSCTKPDAHDIRGHGYHFASYRGKWILVNYWADWCKPCYHEIPQLNALYRAHKDKIVLLGVNFDGLGRNAQLAFAKKYHIQYPLLLDNPANYFGIDEIATLPATFVIGPDGKLRQGLFGPQTKASLEVAMGLNAKDSKHAVKTTSSQSKQAS